jgi:dolichol kinase
MVNRGVVKTVIVRKSLHFLIALSPTFASIHYCGTVLLLGIGTVFFAFAESYRVSGSGDTIISRITNFASHSRDKDRFVLGPVTLGSGALIALLVFPHNVFSISIYALAFGDGFAGLAGRLFGRLRPKILSGKSIEGSFACFIAIFISSYLVTHNYFASCICALSGMIIEVLPAEDFDNILIPVTVGIAASICL